MDQKDSLKAYGAGIFFAVLVGFSFLGVKVCAASAGSLQILTHRYNFGFLALVFVLVLGIAKINLKGKPKKNLLLTAGFYVGFMALQVIGLHFATSIEAAIIFAIIPIIAKIIAFLFLKESSTLLQNLSMCLTVAALMVMIVMGSTEISFDPVGTVFLLLSSLAMGISNVFMRYVRDQYTPMEISATIIIGGFVVFNVVTIVSGLATGTLGSYFVPLKNPHFLLATAYLGIGCILLSAQLMSYCLSKLEAAKGTIFGNVSTAISIVAGVIVLREPLMPYHIICTIFIILGVLGLSLLGKKNQEVVDEV